MSFPDANVKSPVLSPFTNEYSNAQITDENTKVIDLVALVSIDGNGHSNLGSAVVSNGHASQVTGRQEGALVTCPGGEKVRLLGVVSLDTNGNPVPFAPASAAKVTGKFQSTVQTGNGTAQSIAHGLGVVPSLVLVSIYNTNGVAVPYAIVEGAHTSTNLIITMTNNVMYKVIAFA